jgi:hypothetical protein
MLLSCGACHTLAAVGRLPLSKHTGGGGTTPTFSGRLIYSLSGEVSLPTSGGAFHTKATVTSFPHSKVAGWGPPLLPSPDGLFIYSLCEGVHLPTLWISGCPSFFATCLCFFQPLIYYSFGLFFSFFPGLGSVCPGGYADLSQGVPRAVSLLTWWSASPKQVRSLLLAVQEPSWFLHLMWQGDAMQGLRVWRCWSFDTFWWFFLPGASQASLQEFLL